MRQPLALLLCAFLPAIPTNTTQAQERTSALVLGAGATMSSATDEEATESRIGLNVAGGLSLRITDLVGLRAEAGYIQKGGGAEVNEDDVAGHLNIEVDYLVARGLLEIGGDFHVLAGGSIGSSMRCNVAIDVSVSGMSSSIEQSCDRFGISTNREFGITAGAGYNLGSLGATLLFTEGLTEIFADDDAILGRNRTISLIGTIRIPMIG